MGVYNLDPLTPKSPTTPLDFQPVRIFVKGLVLNLPVHLIFDKNFIDIHKEATKRSFLTCPRG